MSDSVTVVTNEENVASVLKAKDANPKIKSVIVVGEPVSGCHSFYEMVKADTFGIDFYKGSSSDTTQELALLPFSSGTTGKYMKREIQILKSVHEMMISNRSTKRRNAHSFQYCDQFNSM